MKKLLLVLGAGASHDLGFPLGGQLLEDVINGLEAGLKDPCNEDLLQKILATQELWKPLGKDLDQDARLEQLSILREKLVAGQEAGKTIDWILGRVDSSEQHLEKIGRFAIAYYLMGHETKAFEQGKFSDRNFWMRAFWEAVIGEWETCYKRLRIITFNYERSMEHCLATALWLRSVNADYEDFVGQHFMQHNIFHVYGSLGEYLQPLTKRDGNKSPFGSPNGAKNNVNLQADMFSLMYDQRVKYSAEDFQAHFDWAERICFLGFGFDPDNMKKLGWDQVNTDGKDVIGTWPDMAEGEYQGIHCKPLKCQEFWDKRCLPLA